MKKTIETPTVEQVIRDAVDNGGSLDLSQWPDDWIEVANRAKKMGFVRLDDGGILTGTVLRVTKEGRSAFRLRKQTFLEHVFSA